MDKNTELGYIKDFAREREGSLEDVEENQLRALWTAYCLHHGLDCDTQAYDEDLKSVWDILSDQEADLVGSDSFYNFHTFDLFMSEYLC